MVESNPRCLSSLERWFFSVFCFLIPTTNSCICWRAGLSGSTKLVQHNLLFLYVPAFCERRQAIAEATLGLMNVPPTCLPDSAEHMQFLMYACQRPRSQALKLICCPDHWIPAVWPWSSWTAVISHIGISVLHERERLCSVCCWSVSGGYSCIASWAGRSQSWQVAAQSADVWREGALAKLSQVQNQPTPHLVLAWISFLFGYCLLSVWRLSAHFSFW